MDFLTIWIHLGMFRHALEDSLIFDAPSSASIFVQTSSENAFFLGVWARTWYHTIQGATKLKTQT